VQDTDKVTVERYYELVMSWSDHHLGGLLKQVALYNACSNGITSTTSDITSSYAKGQNKRAWVASGFVCFCNILHKSFDARPASHYLRVW